MAFTLTPQIDTASPLGYGLLATYCTATRTLPDGSTETVTTVQPTLGLGVNTKTGALLPSASAGQQLLAGALQCRLSTAPSGLVDVEIPTTLGPYGFQVLDLLNADMDDETAGMVSASVDAQIRQDERVAASITKGGLVDSTLVLSSLVQTATGEKIKLTLAIDTLAGDLTVLSSP